MRAMTTIALNAHLLTAQVGYRSAGVNGYIYNLLHALPDADPALRYIVLAGHQGHPPNHARLITQRARWKAQPQADLDQNVKSALDDDAREHGADAAGCAPMGIGQPGVQGHDGALDRQANHHACQSQPVPDT